jgi:transposase InsO family protein
MHGVAYDPVFRAKLMAMHDEGVSLTALSSEFGIARQVLSRWWSRYALDIDLKYLPALRNARNDFEFAAVDDFSREAVVWITTDQTSAAATAFLERVAATLPYPIEAVLTDNAFAFTMRHALHADHTKLTYRFNWKKPRKMIASDPPDPVECV